MRLRTSFQYVLKYSLDALRTLSSSQTASIPSLSEFPSSVVLPTLKLRYILKDHSFRLPTVPEVIESRSKEVTKRCSFHLAGWSHRGDLHCHHRLLLRHHQQCSRDDHVPGRPQRRPAQRPRLQTVRLHSHDGILRLFHDANR